MCIATLGYIYMINIASGEDEDTNADKVTTEFRGNFTFITLLNIPIGTVVIKDAEDLKQTREILQVVVFLLQVVYLNDEETF